MQYFSAILISHFFFNLQCFIFNNDIQGDGGGPIQIKHPKHEKAHLQVGITWYGPTTCGKRDFPSVYVYVPQYVSWIKEVIESNKK